MTAIFTFRSAGLLRLLFCIALGPYAAIRSSSGSSSSATFGGGVVAAAAAVVVVETLTPGSGPRVTRAHSYRSMVTLYIEEKEEDDGGEGGPTPARKRTPSGWSTRRADGAAADQPFVFQPGVNLIAGWTEGVLRMSEGERALLHVPAELGYGSSPMGTPGGGVGAFYIPAHSDLLFDIEILGKDEVGVTEGEKATQEMEEEDL